MASYRTPGCFRCGNSLHRAWECPANAGPAQVKENRQAANALHYEANPGKKSKHDRERQGKYQKKVAAKLSAGTTLWEDILHDVLELCDDFQGKLDELNSLEESETHDFDGGSRMFYEKTLAVQDSTRKLLEKARIVLAVAKEKMNREQEDTSHFEESFSRLEKIRSLVWTRVTSSVVERRNLLLTMEQLEEGMEEVNMWSSEFITYMMTNPKDINKPKIDEAFIGKYQQYLMLLQKADYIMSPSTSYRLQDEVKNLCRRTELLILEAKEYVDNEIRQ